MSLTTLLVCIACLFLGTASYSIEQHEVIELTPDTFHEEVVESTVPYLVAFYDVHDPRTPDIQNMINHVIPMAKNMALIGSLDVGDLIHKTDSFVTKYGITKHPSLKLYLGHGHSDSSEFRGEIRDAQGVVAWLRHELHSKGRKSSHDDDL